MNQIDTAVTLSRRLESLLEAKYQATGKGLHEKVSSVEDKLPLQLVKGLRYIATMRNSVVHEEGFVIDDLKGFSEQGDAALRQLGGKPIGGAWTNFLDWLAPYFFMIGLFGGTLAGAIYGFQWLGDVKGIVIGYIVGFLTFGAVITYWKKGLLIVGGLVALPYAMRSIEALFHFFK